MAIIDSQSTSPGRTASLGDPGGVPNWPDHVTGDEMVAAMDKVGVDGAIFISAFSTYQYDASYAAGATSHPQPICTRQTGVQPGQVRPWPDFLVYGYFAVTISKVFFPGGNETASLLLTSAHSAAPFLVRSLRRYPAGLYRPRRTQGGLTLSILLMVIGMTMTAVMPGYATRSASRPQS